MAKGLSSNWFIHLRWFAFIGQVFVLCLAVWIFKLTISWHTILLLLSLIPLTNLIPAAGILKKFDEKNIIGSLIIFDTILLTAVLCQAGGATNPFTIFYLLQVVLAALMLNSVWTWIAAVISCLGFGSLFLFAVPVPEWGHHGAHHGFSLHLHGMWIAYIVASLLAAYFLNRIAAELRIKEIKLERLKNLERNQQRLTSLTAITAGAAHELGTPLATIAVVIHELEVSLSKIVSDNNILQDIALIKSEIERCKTVLNELSEKTGDLLGEKPESFDASELLQQALYNINAGNKLLLSEFNDFKIYNAPRKALALALRALIKNALECDNSAAKVSVSSELNNQFLKIDVKDSGPGMNQETLERLGEPFFSTKGSGKGMGLGVYLSKLTAEHLGGKLSYSSTPGKGTTATLIFPSNCISIRSAA